MVVLGDWKLGCVVLDLVGIGNSLEDVLEFIMGRMLVLMWVRIGMRVVVGYGMWTFFERTILSTPVRTSSDKTCHKNKVLH